MAEITLTKDNFEEVVMGSDIPVLVDFWASWCGPCRMVAPVVAKIAEEYEGKVIVGKVNVDEEMELSDKYNVMSIPTIIVFRNGEPVATSVGAKSKEQLEELLK